MSLDDLLLRIATPDDLDALYALAQAAGRGMTHLPPDKTLLAEKLASTQTAIQSSTPAANAFYFFILETQGQPIGCSGIYARIDDPTPLTCFEHSTQPATEGTQYNHPTVRLTALPQYHTELSSLFLAPKHRKPGRGAFLSRARYLFMAQHPQRFEDTVLAELRGPLNFLNRSPFWEAIGKRFTQVSYDAAEAYARADQLHTLIPAIPREPIFLELLSPHLTKLIGRAHPHSGPALHLLKKEGFTPTAYVDVLDGGPILSAQRVDIHTVRESFVAVFSGTQSDIRGQTFLLANAGAHFRACLGYAAVDFANQRCQLMPETAAALQLQAGDPVRLALA